MKAKKPEFTTPSISLLCKLGSIMVHAEELLSIEVHKSHKVAIGQLLDDPEVCEWRAAMERAAMLPVKR